MALRLVRNEPEGSDPDGLLRSVTAMIRISQIGFEDISANIR